MNQFPHATISKIMPNLRIQPPQPKDKVRVTYVWVDGTGEFLRSKTRTLTFNPKFPDEIPLWTYCGSATFQAKGNLAEMLLYPRALYPNPFLLENNKLVLCDTYTFDKKPGKCNYRQSCEAVMKKVIHQYPWFSVEQKYAMLDPIDQKPLGWPKKGYPEPHQGPSYCGVGTNNVVGRRIAEDHYEACLYAGIKICEGVNAEVEPAAHGKFKIGLCEGINIGDELWMARYLLHRVAEKYGVVVTFTPELMAGDRQNSGARCTFSTAAMRALEDDISKLERVADKSLSKKEDSSFSVLTWESEERKQYVDRRMIGEGAGGSSKDCCVVCYIDDSSDICPIPRTVVTERKGYVQCQPVSNFDPYRLSEIIVQTVCLDK